MIVRWTPEALLDRTTIWDYIAERDRHAAARLDEQFSAAAERLATFPLLGHPGDVSGTRELTPQKNYRLVYEVVGNTVWILTIIHAARQWPPV